MKAFVALACVLLAGLASAQPPDPAAGVSAPRRDRPPLANVDDIEPAVDVGGPRVAVIDRSAAASAAARTTAAPNASSAPAAPAVPVRSGTRSAGAQSRTASVATPAPKPSGGPVMDTIDLGTTSITGNQELPKVLYIVPWKKSDLGDLVGRPVNTLLDEVLEPVDPEVFQRQLEYYETLHGNSAKE